MENEMMNNMDAMTENLTDAMPEVDNLVPSVDENHAEMGVPVWMSGFDALIDAIDILKNALQNNESPTIVDINRKLCVKYHTSAIAMDRLLRRAVDYAVIRKQTHGPLYYEVLSDTPRQAMPLKQFLYISARYLMREEVQ